MDICGFPKDSYYYYQAWWTDKPVLHLFPHWNWPAGKAQEIPVWVHSNCQEVELFLNGVSQGKTNGKAASSSGMEGEVYAGQNSRQGRARWQAIEAAVETTGMPAPVPIDR